MKAKISLLILFIIYHSLTFAQPNIASHKFLIDTKFTSQFKFIPAQELEINQFEGSDSLCLYFPQRKQVKDFYISPFELSNKEYKMFTDYVWDSIVRVTLDYTIIINGKKQIDWNKKIDWSNAQIKSKIYDSLGIKPDKRIFNRIEKDAEKIIYKYEDNDISKEIKIYPDTTCWMFNFYGYDWVDRINNYFKTEKYSDYPVVGLTYWQALAYCNWKTNEINKLLPIRSNYKIELILPTNIEWEASANNYPQAIFKKNKIIAIPENGRYITDAHRMFIADNKYSISYKYNFFSIIDANGYRFKDAKEDGYVFTAPINSYKPNKNGLYNMLGNVAEWVLEDSTTGISYEVKNLRKPSFQAKGNNRFADIVNDFPNSLFAKIGLDSFALRMKDYKIVKGGGWNSTPFYLQRGVNQYYLPTDNTNFIGFRLVAHIISTSN